MSVTNLIERLTNTFVDFTIDRLLSSERFSAAVKEQVKPDDLVDEIVDSEQFTRYVSDAVEEALEDNKVDAEEILGLDDYIDAHLSDNLEDHLTALQPHSQFGRMLKRLAREAVIKDDEELVTLLEDIPGATVLECVRTLKKLYNEFQTTELERLTVEQKAVLANGGMLAKGNGEAEFAVVHTREP